MSNNNLLIPFSEDLVKLLDDKSIRILIASEIVARSTKEFFKFLRRLFGQTWEFKILKVLMRNGPMNKSQIAFAIFKMRGKHYMLSRSTPLKRSFNHLIKVKIIVIKKDLGRVKFYAINDIYKPYLQLLIG